MVATSSWTVKADVLADLSVLRDFVPALRVFLGEKNKNLFRCFFSGMGHVGMRGECVAKGEVSKAGGNIEEDLEDVFHSCTRLLPIPQLSPPLFLFLQALRLPGEGLQLGVQPGEGAVRVQGGHPVE